MMALGLSIIFFGCFLALLIRGFLTLVKRSTRFKGSELEGMLEKFSEGFGSVFYGLLGTLIFVGVTFCVLDLAVRFYMLLTGSRV